MKFTRWKQATIVNIVLMSVLVVGYFFTTGTELIDSPVAKGFFRAIVGALALFNIFFGRKIKPVFLIGSSLFLVLLILNQNLMGANLIFLLILVASMERLTAKEIALAFFIPCAIVVMLHLLFLASGTLIQQLNTFNGRTRSALGFVNPNQLSVVYLSLAFTAIYLHLQFRRFASRVVLMVTLAIVLPVILKSGSRTSLFSLGLVVFSYPMWFLFLKVKYLRTIFHYLIALSPILATMITFYLAQNSSPIIDLLLSHRPMLFQQYLGQANMLDLLIGWAPNFNKPIDNAFLILLSIVGAPLFIALIIYLSYAFTRLEPIYLPLVFMLIFSSIFESFLLRPEIPLSTLFLLLIMRQQQPKQEKHTDNWADNQIATATPP